MPSAPFDRVILGDLVLPDGLLPDGWVAIRGETIAGLGQGTPPPAAATADPCGDADPAGTGRLATCIPRAAPAGRGSRARPCRLAAGGVTTCVDMPYDVPRPVTDAGILREKVAVVEATSHVDMALYGTITKAGGVEAIAGLAEAGVCSFKLSTL
ncbi:hypothetical protein [Dankookia sp. P2]|uniref:hypothetical protein n=1 Tax=Dankookia sp. P2 TaxID=3423955 RepID=UPI003D678D15